jgi:tetratricopeptide (TPR) repeat protein
MRVTHRRFGRTVLIAFSLSLATAAAAQFQQTKVFGTVLDDQGNPVPDVKVILEPVEGGARVETTAKGKKGSYFFGIVRPGTYIMKIEAEGFVVRSIKATAPDPSNKKKIVWTLDGPVNPEKPPHMQFDDGMQVTCDVVIGPPAAAPGGSAAASGQAAGDAYGKLVERVKGGDCAGTLPDLQAYADANPTSGHAFYLLGYCDAVLEKEDDAIAALTKSYANDPTFSGTQTLLGKMYGRQKKYAEAEAAFRTEIDNAAAPVEVQTDALLGLAEVLKSEGKTDEAIASYQKVVGLSPTRPEPYIELSTLYSDGGQLEKATAILEQAKQAGAADPAAILNVGVTYFNKKDYANAETMFRKVIDGGAPNDTLAMAYALVGRCQLRSGRNADARASFEKSIELDPSGRLAAETKDILKAMQKK